MFEPWCEPWIFVTAYGSFVGAVGGTVLGTAGGVGGDLARKGQRRAWIGDALQGVFIFGIVSLVVGFVAVVLRQPFGISATLLVFGGGMSWLARAVERGLRKLHEKATKSSIQLPGDSGKWLRQLP